MFERDRDVAGLLVLAEQRRGAVVERADDAGDVGQGLQVGDGGVDRARARRVAQGAGGVEQRHRDAAVGLLGQLLLQEVGRLRRAGARQGQVVVPLLPERCRPQVHPDRHDEPHADHDEAVAHARLPHPVERPSQRLTLTAREHTRMTASDPGRILTSHPLPEGEKCWAGAAGSRPAPLLRRSPATSRTRCSRARPRPARCRRHRGCRPSAP